MMRPEHLKKRPGVDVETLPIKRRKLSDEVKERILNRIHNDNLQPGDLLPSERELMSSFGVGRPAIREAMQALQNVGLITVRHGERPKVAEPSFDLVLEQLALTMRHVLTHSDASLNNLKEARVLMETQIARLAAERRTHKDINDLREILEKQAAAEANSPDFMNLDGAFHERVARISGNAVLSSLTHAVFDWMARFHADMVSTPGMESLSLNEHQSIFEAIEAQDADAAAQKMADHLNRANTLYHQQNA